MENYYNIIETIVCMFRVNNGNIEILLKKKKTDPYKGYFLIPGNILPVNETLETSVKGTIYCTTGKIVKKMVSSNIFSDLNRDKEERVIACSYIAVIGNDVNAKAEWFDINNLPMLAFDHERILKDVIKDLKLKIIANENNIVNDFFKDEFSLGDFQKFWECVTGITYDRRNFRKKLFTNNFVTESGNYNRLKAGRPSMLYNLSDSFSGYKII